MKIGRTPQRRIAARGNSPAGGDPRLPVARDRIREAVTVRDVRPIAAIGGWRTQRQVWSRTLV